MNRRKFLSTLSGGLLAAPLAAEAQRVVKPYRVGFLRAGPPPPPWIAAFRQSLRELAWVEGQNIVIDYAIGQRLSQLPELAAELVRRKVDVLVASGGPSVLPAKNATSTIPVVFVASLDPIATGLVPSLARPGGNVTGTTTMYADAIGKQLQLLSELFPKISHIAVLVRDNPESSTQVQRVREAELAARSLGLQLQITRVRDPRDPREFDAAFNAVRGATALIQLDDAVFTETRTQVAQLALKYRLPAMVGHRQIVEAGGLLSYGADIEDLYRHAAVYVDKILKGAKPGDLPIEQPTKFELVINLKTAKALGLTIPPSLLQRADQVIE
jgi:putative tryptophan/tyrosine transport system substrate-binding protein